LAKYLQARIKHEDVVRQDFTHISSKAKNKELDPLAEKSFGVKGIDNVAEEET
jgi:hypothetical protein